jgi:hypothetical protein
MRDPQRGKALERVTEVDAYQAFTLVDDIAFAALKLSLSEPERTIVMERLRDDWMTDVGAIGLLRRLHIEHRSVEEPSRAYWSSRREPHSPRIESLLASFLMNLTSALVYDALKELSTAGFDINNIIASHRIDLGTAVGFIEQIELMTAHVRTFLTLHRAKQNNARVEEVRNIVKEVLAGRKALIESDEAQNAADLIVRNLKPAIRGIISTELRKKNVYTDTIANGVLTRGLGVSPGFGYGVPKRWAVADGSLMPTECVLFLQSTDMKIEGFSNELIERSTAVVTWNCGPTSHLPVSCRAVGRPAVL